jgi:hypothetical protein
VLGPTGANLPNPASVYCEEQGGTLEIRRNESGEFGVCIFADGSQCEEWAFFRGECTPGDDVSDENPTGHEATYEGVQFIYDPAVAAGAIGDTVAAEAMMGDEVIPEHIMVSFNGYTLPGTFHEPRLVIYPVDAFTAESHRAADRIASLRSILESGQLPAPGGGFSGADLPFLPLFNAAQIMHTQIAFLDFQNGRGVRFLTEYAQYFAPINNTDLFYTFQGLTHDGQFYVAAVLPITHPSLPDDASQIPGANPEAFADTYEEYADDIAQQLAGYEASEFTPDLTLLDHMIASLEITP